MHDIMQSSIHILQSIREVLNMLLVQAPQGEDKFAILHQNLIWMERIVQLDKRTSNEVNVPGEGSNDTACARD